MIRIFKIAAKDVLKTRPLFILINNGKSIFQGCIKAKKTFPIDRYHRWLKTPAKKSKSWEKVENTANTQKTTDAWTDDRNRIGTIGKNVNRNQSGIRIII